MAKNPENSKQKMAKPRAGHDDIQSQSTASLSRVQSWQVSSAQQYRRYHCTHANQWMVSVISMLFTSQFGPHNAKENEKITDLNADRCQNLINSPSFTQITTF